MWARGHSFREISDLHRRAAIALGVEREWAYVPMRMSDCPACGEKVKTGVAVCRHCSAILDAEKAAKHGLGLGAAATRLNANGARVCRKEIAGLSAGKKRAGSKARPILHRNDSCRDYSRLLSEFERRRENSASAASPRARRVHCAGSGTLVAVPLVIMSGPSPPQPMQ